MKKKVLFLLIIISVAIYGVFFWTGKEMKIVNSYTSSYGNGCDEHITVILNDLKIENEEELAAALFDRAINNNFKEIKFSYDLRKPSSLSISVYLTEWHWKHGGEALNIEYYHEGTGDPDEFNIVDNPEKFIYKITR